MAAPGSFLSLAVDAARSQGVDLARLGMAWARALPVVTLVPAFGLRALPTEARGALALVLGAVIFPAMAPGSMETGSVWIGLAREAALGVPVAIAAAIPLWAATMAGGVADALRGANDARDAPTVEGEATPTGLLLSLLACGFFFATAGPSRIATALATAPLASQPALRASTDLANGITIAVALGAPLLAASVVVEVAGALIGRAATPAQIHLTLAPLRALALLGVLAVVFGRLSEALAAAVATAMPHGV